MKAEGIFKNHIYDLSNKVKLEFLRKKFSELKSCPHNQFVSLSKYQDYTPEKFYSKVAFEKFLQQIKTFYIQKSSSLTAYLTDNQHELSRSLHLLEEVNRQKWHDIIIAERNYELIKFIDQTVHPNYLRVTEGIFKPISKILAYYSRIQRSVSTDNLDLYNIVEELKILTLNDFVSPIDNTMRNGIAHGGITYLDHDIRYEDKKGNSVQIDAQRVIRMFDALLDISNGMALALKLFLLTEGHGKLAFPRQILIEEIAESTKTGWLNIQGVVDSSIESQRQLLIYVWATSLDRYKVMHSALKTAVLAEQLAPGYDRYFFSFDAPGEMPGWAGMSGRILKECREKGVDSIEGYKGIFEDELFFYNPKYRVPKFIHTLETLWFAIKENYKASITKQRIKWGLPRYEVRVSRVHRNAWGLVLHANIFLNEETLDDQFNKIRTFPRQLIFKALKHAKKYNTTCFLHKWLPLGWSRVSIYRRNQRTREFGNVGLGKDLICTLGIKRIKRIKSPELFGSEIEKRFGVTIAWNKAWIDEFVEFIEKQTS
jgi:hypothetical protein